MFSIHKTKDSDAVFMQWLHALCKLAQSYYTQKTLFLTVQLTLFLQ